MRPSERKVIVYATVLAWAAVANDDGTVYQVAVQRDNLPDGPGVIHIPLGSVEVQDGKRVR